MRGWGLPKGTQDLYCGLSPKSLEEKHPGEVVFLEQIGLCSATGETAAQLVRPSAQGHEQSVWVLAPGQ